MTIKRAADIEQAPKDEIGYEYLGPFPDLYCQVIDAVSRGSVAEEFMFYYCIVKKVTYSTKGEEYENEIKEEEIEDVESVFDDVYEEFEDDEEEEDDEGDDAAAGFASQVDREIFMYDIEVFKELIKENTQTILRKV